MRLTKIVATVGPASEQPEVLEQLIRAGVDVFRLNSAHSTLEEHARHLADIRAASRRVGRAVAVLVDLAGPKIRVGPLQDGRVTLQTGSEVELVPGPGVGDARRLTVTYPGLIDDAAPGSRILLDDGLIELVVLERRAGALRCRVTSGGVLRSHKGINLPGVPISAPAVTAEDERVIDWALGAGVDYLGVSFVRRAEDIRTVRTRLHRQRSPIRVVAKIEKPEAVAELEAIVELADAVMVARGDLGVEMPLEEVPLLQKRIIALCRRLHKPVITATQMLESMMQHPRPTRAEVSDVANAIMDGSDALMLSGETAVGRYPVAAVAVMDRVARRTEAYLAERFPEGRVADIDARRPVLSALSEGVYHISRWLRPRLVAVSSASGDTALLLSKERLAVPVVGVSAEERAVARMCLYYGVRPVRAERLASLDDLFGLAEEVALREGMAEEGDPVLLVAGEPFGVAGTTNTLQVRRVRRAAPAGEPPEVRRWEVERPQGTFCYQIRPKSCISCGVCVARCPADIWVLAGAAAEVREDRLPLCVLERTCERDCPTGAITITCRAPAGPTEAGSEEKVDDE